MTSSNIDRAAELRPIEEAALTVALAQVQRGESPTPSVSVVCVLALARLVGRWENSLEPQQ